MANGRPGWCQKAKSILFVYVFIEKQMSNGLKAKGNTL